ncbi:putative baseplate assembly protein [Carbonactinospora thermoautotrophica]|uniref:putative baseplate assembly protein n=1 Tax=Carbonactinospora thermoautotrophica TaxID=1469144 RepID=UPI00226D71AF|nr:putative baseplate assembly protein [Carbonactinospora thermoautotrophica]MCX9189996.1 putative baseplate assembly protein [Carbonactinospora thermoautotrophica]
MSTECRAERRRAEVRAACLNGVDGVEVSDDGLTLTVTFLGKAPRDLGPEHIRIEGGRRITDVRAIDVQVERAEDPDLDDRVHVTLDKAGDTSTYRLRVVEPDAYGRPGTEPRRGFDPRYHAADFEFRPACPSEFDCQTAEPHPPKTRPQPVIDYLARDYASLRRLLLDRMTLTAPDWVERHVPDLGVTLVELLAYVGDQISYHQDAVATEAYLDTARRRVSVRRHVRLVDYAMHDGCNARAWIVLEADRRVTLERGGFRFAAIDVGRLDPRERPDLGPVLSEEDLARLPHAATCEVFEPVGGGDLTLYPEHNRIPFWTWGEEEGFLPEGATSATLRDEWAEPAAGPGAAGSGARGRKLRLKPGDVIVIEEVLGRETGSPADADPAHRQAVRLTSVTPAVDELYDQPVLEVTWDPADALAFPVCVRARGGPDCRPLGEVSVARGNVVLADHGRGTDMPETFAAPPEPVEVPRPPGCGCPDRAEASAPAAEIQDRLAQARRGERLTVEQVRALRALLGEDAVTRAGLTVVLEPAGTGHATEYAEAVAPAAAADQAAALETLLAQVTYPRVRQRFRPVLRHAPVTQCEVYPVRAAAGQARLLAGIPEQVRARLEQLWRQVEGGTALTRDQVAELTTLFGAAALAGERSAGALRELLARRERLLAAKLRRLAVLTARAQAGTVLDADVVWEIAQSWGDRYAAGLHPEDPVLAGPASAALRQDPRAALPAVTVTQLEPQSPEPPAWTPRRDLLGSGPRDRHVVGEVEDGAAGRLALRFGDGRHGAPPPAGSRIAVTYRVGNGTAGNVGADTINHLVLRHGVQAGVTRVRNPLPAAGGTDPEPLDQARQLAPLALKRTRLRAVTAGDYAELAARVPGAQRAAAEIRWTGRGQEVHVAVDPLGPATADPLLLDAVADALERYRRIGHDLVVGPALLVPLDIELAVCVAPGHQRGHVLDALRRVLGSRTLADGRPGFFHPDAVSFGEPVRLSRLVAAAAAVPGVLSARVTRLRRLFGPDSDALQTGLLRLGPLEVAQCDNDPDRPENGRLALVVTR